MKTILKLTLAVVVAGLLTACAMKGLQACNAANQSISVGAQTNSAWAGRATGQFMDQLASAAVR
jgi:ABC-type xylose transport system substrate-binding protein